MLAVFLSCIALVAAVGFLSSRWWRSDVTALEEWGLAGRQFGAVITWCLIGGDFYTAYTLIAVPALVFGVGASGFFALVYTILVYPFVFVVMPRLWTVAQRDGYITLADFVRGCYNNRWLALAVALSGIAATVPYIALQLAGMQVAMAALGPVFGAHASGWPLVAAFALLAAYDFSSGLRAPASIAVVKDVMIYTLVIAAAVWIPMRLGGYGHIFSAAARSLAVRPVPGFLILPPKQYLSFATLALGSALAAFLYPHMATSVLSARSARTIQRNAIVLPAYTLLLGLVALLGYMAIAAGLHPANANDVVPQLIVRMFGPHFAGFCLATIVIGGLVPAAIMAIAAASLFARNVYHASPAQEARVAKWASLLIKLAALAFVLSGRITYIINFQLLGGIWILQTLPAIVFGLYRRRLAAPALLAGWVAGTVVGTLMAIARGSVYPLHIAGLDLTAYAAIDALVVNLVIATACQLFSRPLARIQDGGQQPRQPSSGQIKLAVNDSH